jgi:hypothetical protein
MTYAYVTGKVGALPAVRQSDVVPLRRRLKQPGIRVHNGWLVLG